MVTIFSNKPIQCSYDLRTNSVEDRKHKKGLKAVVLAGISQERRLFSGTALKNCEFYRHTYNYRINNIKYLNYKINTQIVY